MDSEYLNGTITNDTHRALIYQWAFERYGPLCNQGALAMLSTDYNSDIRAYLYGEAIFTTWDILFCTYEDHRPDDQLHQSVFKSILASTPERIPVFGYPYGVGCNEHWTVTTLNTYGKYFVPTALFHSMGFWQNLPIPTDYQFSQSTSRNASHLLNAKGKADPRKIYVAPILSDGDNLQFVQLGMKVWYWETYMEQNLSVPLTFEFSPLLYEYAPALSMIYYQQQTDDVYFVNGVGGMAYSKSAYFSKQNHRWYWEQTKSYMQLLDQREVRTWTSGDIHKIINILNPKSGSHQCDAIFEGYFGDEYRFPEFYNGVPFAPMKFFSTNTEIMNQTTMALHKMLEMKNPQRPLFVPMHINCWDFNVETYDDYVRNLTAESDGQIKFINIGQMSHLIHTTDLARNENLGKIIFALILCISLVGIVTIQYYRDKRGFRGIKAQSKSTEKRSCVQKDQGGQRNE